MKQLDSWLPEGGENLFQTIKKMRTKVRKKGIKLLDLAIGQPSGAALLKARAGAAVAVLSDEESMHEYQDNGSPGVPEFAEKFVLFHQGENPELSFDLKKSFAHFGIEIAYLPIPGIKPMLGLIPLACGANQGRSVKVGTMTNPGYPTPADWCNYLGVSHFHLKTTPENGFLFEPDWTPAYGKGDISHHTNLLMLNLPHNPTGQIGMSEWWSLVCEFCQENGIRIFNDAAYAMLAHKPGSVTLASVALEFPNLSWAEAYSASKLIGNGTGWRVGAMIGSQDFIEDIAKTKGNTDSGFFAPAAAGVLEAISDPESRKKIREIRDIYAARIRNLTVTLQNCGMRIAVEPKAGFFTLWQVPKKAFGQKIQSAEHFNQLMAEKKGVIGAHFEPGYIRYSVAAAHLNQEEPLNMLWEAFQKTNIQY